jgi:carbon storage regulator
MLVLTRKLLERVYIGDDICVTVVRIDGGQVRLGIEAPRAISVVRAELVPEREQSRPKPRAAVARRPAALLAPPLQGRTGLTTQPALAHGIGSRRRARSQ